MSIRARTPSLLFLLLLLLSWAAVEDFLQTLRVRPSVLHSSIHPTLTFSLTSDLSAWMRRTSTMGMWFLCPGGLQQGLLPPAVVRGTLGDISVQKVQGSSPLHQLLIPFLFLLALLPGFLVELESLVTSCSALIGCRDWRRAIKMTVKVNPVWPVQPDLNSSPLMTQVCELPAPGTGSGRGVASAAAAVGHKHQMCGG